MACDGVVYIATSTDGYIADKDGGVDWLHSTQPEPKEGETCGLVFEDFMETVDAIVMGRKTFEQVITFCIPQGPHPWPYGKKPMIVMSSNAALSVPDTLRDHVTVSTGTPLDVLKQLAIKYNAQTAYIDGGTTIRGFHNVGAINRAFITRVPVTLGEGVPLFSEEQMQQFETVETIHYGSGWSITEYKKKTLKHHYFIKLIECS